MVSLKEILIQQRLKQKSLNTTVNHSSSCLKEILIQQRLKPILVAIPSSLMLSERNSNTTKIETFRLPNFKSYLLSLKEILIQQRLKLPTLAGLVVVVVTSERNSNTTKIET